MNIWTTFCPSKVSWELTYIQTAGKKPDSGWQKKIGLIEDSVKILKTYGISGVRLVIYPGELSIDGKNFRWQAIDTMLELCSKNKLAVILCTGPFQFPYYPGIYLPPGLLNQVFTNDNALDTNPVLAKYGNNFISQLLNRYSDDSRIYGFHFANEWPDTQAVAGKEHIKKSVSEYFMLAAAQTIKQATRKPVFLNTNIDAANKKKLTNTFTNILTILGNQGHLGYDIYPSQETWRNVPWQKLLRFFYPYQQAITWSQKKFQPCGIFFCEVEAQPWGNGQSWYQIIKNAPNPHDKVLTFAVDSLEKTWKRHIHDTTCQLISLWGSDFWLSAQMMGITWPLEQVKRMAMRK